MSPTISQYEETKGYIHQETIEPHVEQIVVTENEGYPRRYVVSAID